MLGNVFFMSYEDFPLRYPIISDVLYRELKDTNYYNIPQFLSKVSELALSIV